LATPDQLRQFGERLRQERERQRFTRRALSDAIGALLGETPVSEEMVRLWEAGGGEPRRRRVIAAEDVLQLPEGTLTEILGWSAVGRQADLTRLDLLEGRVSELEEEVRQLRRTRGEEESP
jgi:transcriptional regulator with XRE-family HTH domain